MSRLLLIMIAFTTIIIGLGAAGNLHSSSLQVISECPAGAPGVEELIEEFRLFPPTAVRFGTLVVVGTEATQQVINVGLPAVRPLLSASNSEDRLIAMYSVFSLGEIIVNTATENPQLTRPCKELVVSELQELRTRYHEIADNIFDFTVAGTIDETLGKLGHPPVRLPPPPPAPCCVTDIQIVFAGGYQGGHTLDDYYKKIKTAVDAGRMDPIWDSNNTAGPFDIPQPLDPVAGRRLAGVTVQFIGTCTGDRTQCNITQHYTVPASTYPDEGPTAIPVDDMARTTLDEEPEFRRNIGANQLSWADGGPSNVYDPAGRYANYQETIVFESCKESNNRTCKWDKCCVSWTWTIEVTNGAVVTNTVTADRKWCEKKF